MGIYAGNLVSPIVHQEYKAWRGHTILFNKVFMLNVVLQSREISACPKNSTIS